MRGLRRVHIAGLTFDSHPDHHGSRVFVLGELKSWLGGGSWRREEVARPFGPGAFDLRGYSPQKVIPMSGSLLAHDPRKLQRMIRELTGLLADGESATMTVTDDAGTTSRQVRLAESASIRELDKTSAEFDVSFWAADPRAYGETRTVPPSKPAVQYGTTAAAAVVNVVGSGSGYTIQSQGRVFQVTKALASGVEGRVNFATGVVTHGGVELTDGIGRAELFSIPKGAGVGWSITGATGTLTTTDTYI